MVVHTVVDSLVVDFPFWEPRWSDISLGEKSQSVCNNNNKKYVSERSRTILAKRIMSYILMDETCKLAVGGKKVPS
jgi:hypothetical protein